MNAPIVFPKLSPQALAERWHALLAMRGLPEMFEIDEFGELIEMNPRRLPHQRIVGAVQRQLETQLGGEALPGVGVLTSIGVRIPDVVWNEAWRNTDPADPAPAVCVEVQSPDNSRKELSDKVAAYLEAGAREVILVELSGRIRWFGADGERAASAFGLALQLPDGSYPLQR
jgi:Uma2 family endonuclease